MADKLRTPFQNPHKVPSLKDAPGVYDHHTTPSVSKPADPKVLPEKFFDTSSSLKPSGKSPVRSPMDGPK